MKTIKEKELFRTFINRIWKDCGYDEEEVTGVPYGFFDDGKLIGSFEIRTLDEASFYPDWLIEINAFEIDKVAILRSHRNFSSLCFLLVTLLDLLVLLEAEYVTGLLSPGFFGTLKDKFKLPFKWVGEPFHYKGDDVVPFAISLKTIKRLDRMGVFYLFRKAAGLPRKAALKTNV